MKKMIKVLLFVLILNVFSSFAYAGIDEFPRPDSYEPVATTTMG